MTNDVERVASAIETEQVSILSKTPLATGAKVIAAELQSWLDWNERTWRKEGREGELPDDLHIYAPPEWPTRGAIKAWISHLGKLAETADAATSESRVGVVCLLGQEREAREIWPDAKMLNPGQATVGHRFDLIVVICEERLRSHATQRTVLEFSRWVDEHLATKLSRDGKLVRLA